MVAIGFKRVLAEANAVIETISVDDAKEHHGRGDVIFVDVRDANERESGFVARSIHAPRGFLEFIVDPESPMRNEAFTSGILTCPWHSTPFNVKTGQAQPGGVTDDPVPTYEIRIEGNDIQIKTP